VSVNPMAHGRNQVVVHFLSGGCVQGYTNGFNPMRGQLDVSLSEAGPSAGKVRVQLSNVKAVFFVKALRTAPHDDEVLSPEALQAKPGTRRLVVKFRDGEVIVGGTHAYSPTLTGFFIEPLNPNTNNEHIFVSRVATDRVRLLLPEEDLGEVLTEMGVVHEVEAASGDRG